MKTITLPKGKTTEDIKRIIAEYDNLHEEVEKGMHRSTDKQDWSYYIEDDGYIDRYKEIDDAEFVITTDKETDETYLSEFIKISIYDDGLIEDVEEYSYGQLLEMVKIDNKSKSHKK